MKVEKRKKLSPLKLAKLIANLSKVKKAEDVILIDVRKISSFCDFFVIMTGNVDVHIKAILEYITSTIKKNYNILPHHIEGEEFCRWVVIDYIDVVVHIMNPQLREFYALEKIWAKGKKVSYERKIKRDTK